MKGNKTSGSNAVATRLAIGALMCTGITIVFTAISAALVSAGTLPETAISYIGMIILLLGAFGGTATGARNMQEKRLYFCVGTGAVYFAILLAITALFFEGKYTGVGLTAVMVLAGTMIAALLGGGKGKQRNLRRSKIKRR